MVVFKPNPSETVYISRPKFEIDAPDSARLRRIHDDGRSDLTPILEQNVITRIRDGQRRRGARRCARARVRSASPDRADPRARDPYVQTIARGDSAKEMNGEITLGPLTLGGTWRLVNTSPKAHAHVRARTEGKETKEEERRWTREGRGIGRGGGGEESEGEGSAPKTAAANREREDESFRNEV